MFIKSLFKRLVLWIKYFCSYLELLNVLLFAFKRSGQKRTPNFQGLDYLSLKNLYSYKPI